MIENPIFRPATEEFWAAALGEDSKGCYPLYDRYQGEDISEHPFSSSAQGKGVMPSVHSSDGGLA